MAKKTTATTAKKKKNCTSGKSFPCGYSCQAIGRNCRNPLDGQAKNHQEWLKLQGSKVSTPAATVGPSPKKRTAKSQSTPVAPSPPSALDNLTPNAKAVIEFTRRNEPLSTEDRNAIAAYAKRNKIDNAKVNKILADAKSKGVNLDRDEAIALHYALTGYAFAEVNRPMWDASVKDKDLTYGKVSEYVAINKGLNRALAQLSPASQKEISDRYPNKKASNRELTRYAKLEGAALDSFLGQWQQGTTVTTGQIFPTTIFTDPNERGIKIFSKGANIVFKVKTPPDYRQSAARHVDHYKHQAVEGEMLYPSGTEFKVNKVTKKGNIHTIEIEEVPKKSSDDVLKAHLDDFNKALDSGDVALLSKSAIALNEELSHTALAEGESDNFLKGISRARGFDGKPALKSKAEINAEIAGGAYQLARGFNAIGIADKGASFYDDFARGEFFIGKGVYGNGTYVGYGAKAYSATEPYVSSNYNLSMTLPKSAKIAQLSEVDTAIRKIDEAITNIRSIAGGADVNGLDNYYTLSDGKVTSDVLKVGNFIDEQYGDVTKSVKRSPLSNGNTKVTATYQLAPNPKSPLAKTLQKSENKGRLQVTKYWEETPETIDPKTGFVSKTLIDFNSGKSRIKITTDPKTGLEHTENLITNQSFIAQVDANGQKNYHRAIHPLDHYVKNPFVIPTTTTITKPQVGVLTGLDSTSVDKDDLDFRLNALSLLSDRALVSLAKTAYNNHKKHPEIEALQNLIGDRGRVAALLGYDAYIANKSAAYMVILNRSKLSVEDKPISQAEFKKRAKL